jgi:glucan-binding YG repeat protein
MILAATLSVSSLSAVNVNAAQTAVSSEFTVQRVDSNENIIVSSSTTTKKTTTANKTVKLGWVKKNNKWYYVTKKGNKTGWAKIDGKKYYFNSKGEMQTGIVTIKGKKYYFAKSGEMQTGWKKLNKKWYYFEKDGHMKTGWKRFGERRFYLDPETGAMVTGWKKIKDKTYYFRADGVRYNGPHVYKIKKKYYFFEKDGALTTTEGWKVSDLGNHFYTYKDGTVAVNTEIDGKIISSDGVGVIKTNNEMDRLVQGYGSDTKYLVLANLDAHSMYIYKGCKGEWKRIKSEWEFSCGAPATRTPTGQFKLCWKEATNYGWKDFAKCRAAYVYWTTAGFMLHTILYDKWGSENPEYAEIADDRLGMNISMSCIRLSLEHARWIYTNIPTGTRLVVIE